MNYEGWLPYVMPHCPSCPRETALHHIRQAAITFCERTQVWEEDLDAVLGDGFSNEYALALDDQVALSKLREVWVQDSSTSSKNQYEIADARRGREAIRNGETCNIAWTLDRTRIGVHPAPVADAVIDVTATLKPSQGSYSFPDVLFEHHAHRIASGALCELLDLPGTTWRDSLKAGLESAKFHDAITTVAAEQRGGYARKRRDPSARFF